VSFFFFMTQYLQGVAGYSPLEAGLAFLPVTGAAFAAAALTSRVRVDNDSLAIAGCAAMLIGTAWMSRLSFDTGYLLGIAAPMILFGIGQGLGLSSLTTAGMAGVTPRDAAVAGGLVNVSHHLGGALGLGTLVTVFDAAGPGLAPRVSATLTAACVFLVLALAVTVPALRQRSSPPCRSPAAASTRRRARPTGSPETSTSTP
jgi:predicted MFS family arabinose efflux permease